MAQTWNDRQLGKPGAGGLANSSAKTASAGVEIVFGKGLVMTTGSSANEGEVTLPAVNVGSNNTASKQFAGIAGFSQDAGKFKAYGGDRAAIHNNSVVGEAYIPGDVVKLVDRGPIIVKIDTTVRAGDHLYLLASGNFGVVTEASGGTKEAYKLDAVALSNGVATNNISIELYSLGATVVKHN
jgi:hypothetical protein